VRKKALARDSKLADKTRAGFSILKPRSAKELGYMTEKEQKELKEKKEPEDKRAPEEPKELEGKKEPEKAKKKKEAKRKKGPEQPKEPEEPEAKKEPEEPEAKKEPEEPEAKKEPEEPKAKKEPEEPKAKKEAKEKKEPKEKPLDRMTAKELRDVALGLEGIVGVHAMNKSELLAAVKKAKGIVDEKKRQTSVDVRTIKRKIRELRSQKEAMKEAGDKKKMKILRRRINRLKKKTRRVAMAG
jgi:hypothetical protein